MCGWVVSACACLPSSSLRVCCVCERERERDRDRDRDRERKTETERQRDREGIRVTEPLLWCVSLRAHACVCARVRVCLCACVRDGDGRMVTATTAMIASDRPTILVLIFDQSPIIAFFARKCAHFPTLSPKPSGSGASWRALEPSSRTQYRKP